MTAISQHGLDFLVRRDALDACAVSNTPPLAALPLRAGQAALSIDSFALTAHSLTCAQLGDTLAPAGPFPTERAGWERLPVWGFATVRRSRHPEIAEGMRVYGLLPSSTQLVVTPVHVRARGFRDASPERANLPALYSEYCDVARDPLYHPEREAELSLYRPLFTAGLMIDDFLASRDAFGAEVAIFSSASSKTAYTAALNIALRKGIDVIGLTSRAHVAFAASLSLGGRPLYREVLAYDELVRLPRRAAAVFVDFAGNRALRRAVHAHLGDKLKHSSVVGTTHWTPDSGEPSPLASAATDALPGVPPTPFSAPAQVARRVAEWGPAGFAQKLAERWEVLLATLAGPTARVVQVVRAHGTSEVERIYRALRAGRLAPNEGHVLSLSPAP